MLVLIEKQIISKDRVVLGAKKKRWYKIPMVLFWVRGVVLKKLRHRWTRFFMIDIITSIMKWINAKKIAVISKNSLCKKYKILISIDNSTVYEFLARPDDEYLESVAKESVEGTYHFKELESKQIFHSILIFFFNHDNFNPTFLLAYLVLLFFCTSLVINLETLHLVTPLTVVNELCWKSK
jgi:hypothetical protein